MVMMGLLQCSMFVIPVQRIVQTMRSSNTAVRLSAIHMQTASVPTCLGSGYAVFKG